MLKMKKRISEMKNLFDGLRMRLGTTEEGIGDHKYRPMETNQKYKDKKESGCRRRTEHLRPEGISNGLM